MTVQPFGCALKAWHDHQSELKGYLIHRLADRDLAEDMLQDVFLKAMRAGEHFCSLDNPRAWLFQVARNAVVDHLRLAKEAVPLADDLVQEEPTLAPVEALAECLERVLAELPPDDRDIIRRCDLEKTTLRLYAETHDLTLPAAKSRIRRARQRMRDAMVRHCRVRFDDAGMVCCHVPREPA